MSYLIVLTLYLVAIIFLIRYHKKHRNLKQTLVGYLGIGMLSALVYLGLGEINSSNYRKDFKQAIKELESSPITLVINGDTIKQNTSELLETFATVSSIAAHHSSPIDRFETAIIKQDNQLEFTFYRDSNIPTEYWVQYMDRRIGRFQSDKFADLHTQQKGIKYNY